MTVSNRQAWQGQIWLGDDHGLLVGRPGHTDRHAHYAHQVLIGLDAPVWVEVDGQRLSGPLLLVESGQEHAILSQDDPCITVFAEPLAFSSAALLAACDQGAGDPQRLARLLRDWPRPPLDARLGKALARIRGVDEHALPAEELARAATLSISQLERLFSGSLGLSVRRLVLWQRLRQALQLALAGHRLTDAALAAGFADSAHFSRSVRSQFGIRAGAALRHLRLGTLA
ncbi:AraC family transcriptional regulator [Pseudomonas reidholzensis]|uniref:AraC family transcriptional regulator n=1 Tax=Pseudomonas reidholzensis TaxID=1785162 RepID=A0A383RW86_9PSED|nr:AraC family transcriptional regulator [Pseudomonas reidholzensis]SYX90736.1 AraC family transcriptional regulator [Pseudomonas reidholzensis]